jgi:lysozyme
MRTSEQGRKLITQFEGEILKVYLDPVGLPTVGVGHLVKPNEKDVYPLGKKITKAESQDLLSKDLARFEGSINSLVKVPLTQNQFDALVSLVFNIGRLLMRF